MNKKNNQKRSPPDLIGMDFSQQQMEGAVKNKNALVLGLQYGHGCELACIMCYAAEGKEILQMVGSDNPKPLSLDDYARMFGQAKDIGIDAVHISGEGDPLINLDEFFDLLSLAREHDLLPVVYSHCAKVDRDIAKRLDEFGASVIGKLHSLNPKINEFLVGNSDVYNYVQVGGGWIPENMLFLMERGLGEQNRLGANCIVMSANYSEAENVWEFMRSQSIIPMMEFMVLSGNAKDYYKMDVGAADRVKLHRRIYELDQSMGLEYDFSLGPFLGHRKCDSRPIILLDLFGNARLCVSSYEEFGNFRDQELGELVESHYRLEESLGRNYGNEGVFCECAKYCKDKIRCQEK
ncbi:radical SAM protein [Candidatus Woesearchaeota archaeon]|jgi:MoaA/NifB/PqqE/SkfB family radical SAM enzyme|nr:radical SAM protein [Candidatus Woesearchaeota archaeon]